MSKLKLKYIEGEFNTSLIDFAPSDNGFMLNVEIGIGDENSKGAEAYSFNICDEKGLLRIIRKDSEFIEKEITALADYHLLVMKSYNYENMLQYLDGILRKIPENISNEEKQRMLGTYFFAEQI